jgi:hypothetical protein
MTKTTYIRIQKYIVTCRLKARIVKSEETVIAR